MDARPTPIRFRVIVAIAAALALFSTTMSWQVADRARPVPYLELAALNGFYWFSWAILAPSIVRLGLRFRFERQGWYRALGVHVLAAIVYAEAHIVAQELFRRWLTVYWWERQVSMPFLSRLRASMIQYVDWEMMTYWALLFVTLAVTYYREAQERSLTAARLETRLVETQLRTLQSQLQPHFLFNTLHAISALMHIDVEEADRMLSRLGGLLRVTLDHAGQQEVSLKDELDFLERYLQIEQTRFRDRLTVKFEIAPETRVALVPWMLLQPLVENAIKHGISPRSGPGVVEVHARRERDRLVLEVLDDGVGLSHDGMAALQAGIGVSTTRARLEHLFGRDYQFEFHHQLRGVKVRVVLPWRAGAGVEQQKTA